MFRSTIFRVHVVLVLLLTSSAAQAQTNWAPHGENPIGSPFLQNNVPSVVYDEDLHLWRAWYGRMAANRVDIAYAKSKDGVEWYVPQGIDIVLADESGAAWKNCGKWSPSVIFDPAHPALIDNVEYDYQMWYTGWCGLGRHPCDPCPGRVDSQIGYAVSHDGESWIPSEEPVLTSSLDDWDAWGMHMPSVVRDPEDGLYKMWYTALNTGKIGFATSVNGCEWKKHSAPLNLGEGSTINCDVIHNGTHYEMWFSKWNGLRWDIHYARSLGGIVWTREANSQVVIPNDGAWDDAGTCNPTVFFEGESYRMWYTGDCRDVQEDSWLTGTATAQNELLRPHFRVEAKVGNLPDGFDALAGQSMTFDASRSNSPLVPNLEPEEFSYS